MVDSIHRGHLTLRQARGWNSALVFAVCAGTGITAWSRTVARAIALENGSPSPAPAAETFSVTSDVAGSTPAVPPYISVTQEPPGRPAPADGNRTWRYRRSQTRKCPQHHCSEFRLQNTRNRAPERSRNTTGEGISQPACFVRPSTAISTNRNRSKTLGVSPAINREPAVKFSSSSFRTIRDSARFANGQEKGKVSAGPSNGSPTYRKN